jgi:selenocysteine-specific elongation factor
LLDAFGGWRVGSRFISSSVREKLVATSDEILDAFHAEHPLDLGAPLQWLRSRLDAPDEVATALLASLAAEGHLVVEQGLVAKAGFTPKPSLSQIRLSTSVTEALVSAGAEPPSVEEIADRLAVPGDEVLSIARWLARDGSLVAVEPNRYYTRSAVDFLKQKLGAGMSDGREYAPAELRDLLGLTRKFLIPFLEYCDREGYTIRTGLGRRLSAPSA